MSCLSFRAPNVWQRSWFAPGWTALTSICTCLPKLERLLQLRGRLIIAPAPFLMSYQGLIEPFNTCAVVTCAGTLTYAPILCLPSAASGCRQEAYTQQEHICEPWTCQSRPKCCSAGSCRPVRCAISSFCSTTHAVHIMNDVWWVMKPQSHMTPCPCPCKLWGVHRQNLVRRSFFTGCLMDHWNRSHMLAWLLQAL